MLSLNIERANPSDFATLNALAFRSKCYWPYPLDYLAKCIDDLHLSLEDIQTWPVYIAKSNNEAVGFFALKVVNGEPRLDHLWIDPRFIGRGIGRRLFSEAIQEAKRIEWPWFRIAADPFAEEFYLKLGAKRIGQIQSRIKPDLYLPHLEVRVFHG